MITLRIYRGIEYTTGPLPGGLWRWTCYPQGLIGPKCEGIVAGSEGEAAEACRAAIDALTAKTLALSNSDSDDTPASSFK